jgi:hypothetical protein
MEFLFAEDGKLITYQPIGHQWSPREREWTIVIVECSDEDAQSILYIVDTPSNNEMESDILAYAYLDNFDNLDGLDFSTFSNRLVYRV